MLWIADMRLVLFTGGWSFWALPDIEDYYSVDERALLDAYRKHPEMQKAVKTLLGIE